MDIEDRKENRWRFTWRKFYYYGDRLSLFTFTADGPGRMSAVLDMGA